MDLSKVRDKPREQGLIAVGAMIAVMWVLEGIDQIDSNRLDQYGIHPRNLSDIWEIFSAPFLHFGWDHLIGNTIPFAVMGAMIAFSGLKRVLTVTALTAIVSGVGVWLISPANSVSLGASGVVFGFAGYLIARGVFARSLVQLLVGAVVIALFGAALLSSAIPHQGVSWQAHVFGAIGGVLAARALAPRSEDAAGVSSSSSSRLARA